MISCCKSLPGLLTWVLLGCFNAALLADTTPVRLKDGWQVQAAAEAGFDQQVLADMTARLEQNHFPNAHLVLVEYDGRLVYEKYLSGEDQNWGSDIGHVTFAPDVKHDLRSITKSVTALLLGIALERTRHGQLDAALSTSIMDSETGKLEAMIDVDKLPHPGPGANWNDPNCGPVAGYAKWS